MGQFEDDRDGELWRAFVAASPDMVLVVDPEGTIQSIRYVRGPFKTRTLVGAKIWELAPDDGEPRLRAKLREVLETRAGVRYEAQGYLEDGSVGWYEVIVIPVVADREVQRIIWCTRDITARQVAAEELKASGKRFRAMVEHGLDCIAVADAEGSIQYASPAVVRALGYTPEEMVGTNAFDYLHPEDVAGTVGPATPPGTPVESTVRLRHKDGSWRWLEGTATNLLHDPAVRAIVFNRRDVTERVRERERLAFQAALLTQVNEPIVATDFAGAITHWNEASARLFGWTAEEAIGAQSDELLRPNYVSPGGHDALVASLRTTGTWRGEMTLAAKSGDAVTVEGSIRVLRESATVVTVMNDVTARKQLEEQLRQSQKMEAIGLLAGGVAHDFNNLLAIILGFSEIAARKLPPGHPVGEQLGEVVSAAQRGADLTRKLLAFSRKQIIQARPLDLRATVDDFTRVLGRLLGEDIELEVERGPDAIVVRADAVQLEQVLLNLCTNARQAMPNGGRLRLTARVVRFDEAFAARYPWARPGTFAELLVSDTGIGMDEPTRQRVFEPFFTTKRDGTGLGLATVYGIVQQHGGFVRVESVPGAGTTFRVFLPCAPEEVPLAAPPARPRPLEGARGHESILLAEDEPSLRSLVTSTLSELGYRVIPTGDGEEAVREYAQRSKDIALVVMDVVLPRLGAREAYERMRGIRPDVKVLFTTGYAPEATRLAELLETSRMPLLEKPFTPQALAAMVRTAIDR